jgi:hypothetical protein
MIFTLPSFSKILNEPNFDFKRNLACESQAQRDIKAL